jgi:hypothetical protein
MTWDVKTKGHNLLIPDAGQPKSRGVPASLHMTFLNRLHPVFLAAFYFQSSLQLPMFNLSPCPQSPATIMLSCTPSRRLESLE